MHPWEDFAETFTLYLELITTLDTAAGVGLGGPGVVDELDGMLEAYRRLGEALNVMNRSVGLGDHMVWNMTPAVIGKIRFIHEIVLATAAAP
jgi:hypothetical protein